MNGSVVIMFEHDKGNAKIYIQFFSRVRLEYLVY